MGLDEKREGNVLVLDDLATRQLAEELTNGLSVSSSTAGSLVSRALLYITFDDLEELLELNVAVLISSMHYLGYLSSVLDQAKRNQRILQLVCSNGPRAIIIQRVKVLAELCPLIGLEVDVVALVSLSEPVVDHAIWVEEEILLSDREGAFLIVVLVP